MSFIFICRQVKMLLPIVENSLRFESGSLSQVTEPVREIVFAFNEPI